MKSTLFSTDDLPPGARYEAWRERDWPSLAPVMDTSPPDGPFSARTETFMLAGMPLSFCRMAGLRYERSASRIRRDGIDHLGIVVMLDGRYAGEAGDTSFRGQSGTVLIGELGRPFRQSSSHSRSVTLALPRALVRRALPMLEGVHGMVLDGAAAALIIDHLSMLRRHLDHIDDAAAPMLAESLANSILAGLVISGQRLAPDARGDAVARMRTARIVEERLSDPALGVDLLVALTGLSRSTLYRAFAGHGGIAGHIRRRRLECARTAIVDPRDTRQIAEIALRNGFVDPAQFSRAFRSAYGISPRRLRSDHRERDRSGQREDDDQTDPDRR